MHIDDITGSIAVGKSADLFVSKGNPLEDLKVLREAEDVIIKGKIIVHPHPKKNDKMEKMLDSLI
jgi:Imidazolonepropionase and related amidohydrolases